MITAIASLAAVAIREAWRTAQRPARVLTLSLGSPSEPASGPRNLAANAWTSTGTPERSGSSDPSSSSQELARLGGGEERPVWRHHDQPRRVRDIGELGCRDQQACPDPFREMWRQPVDVVDLPPGERSTRLAVEADVAPAGAADAQHRPQLVAEAEWLEDVAVAGARLQLTVSRLGEGAHAQTLPRERRPLVHVLIEELVLDEVWNRLGRKLLLVRLGEEERRRIDGCPEGRIEGHRSAQPRQDPIP